MLPKTVEAQSSGKIFYIYFQKYFQDPNRAGPMLYFIVLTLYLPNHCAAPVMWEIVRPWATMLGSSVLLWFEACILITLT